MKMKKPYVMGGMLLLAAILFLLMLMDTPEQKTMNEQEVSLRAEAKDLSIDDMINTVDNRKTPSHEDVAPGFVGSTNGYTSSNNRISRNDDPEAIARIQAAIRENKESLSAGLQQINAERNGYSVSDQETEEEEDAQEKTVIEKSREKSPKQAKKVDTAKPAKEDIEEEVEEEEPEKMSPFNSIRLTTSTNRNAIKAYVHSEQVVMAGSTLKMRLGEDAYTDNGVLIPKNSPVYGVVTGIDGERVNVKITHINLTGNILPFEKEVYSKDALLGIYVPGNPKAETAKDVTGGALEGLPTSGIPGVDAAAQIAGVVASSAANAGKQAISKNVKKIKVTIKTNYEIYLRPEEKK